MALQEELGPCDDFTRVHLNSHLLRIVARVSGRIFVGPEVGRSEEYLDMGINFTVELMKVVNALRKIKPEERDAKVGDLPEFKRLTQRRKNTLDFLRPLIIARRKALADDLDYQVPDDVVQWILSGGQNKYGEQSDQELAEAQVSLLAIEVHIILGEGVSQSRLATMLPCKKHALLRKVLKSAYYKTFPYAPPPIPSKEPEC